MLNKHWLVLTLLSVFVLATLGCTRQQSGTFVPVEDQPDTDYFRSIGLEPYWSYDLQMDPFETIKQIWLEPNNIYCLTSENRLHCLDRDTGVTNWMRQPAAPPRLVRRPIEADGKTLVVAHNVAKVYETLTARLLVEQTLAFGPNSDPAFDGEVLYVADSSNHVVAIELQSGREIWRCQADKTISARPVLMGTTLISASESGEVSAYDTQLRIPLWQEHFRTRGAIVIPPVLTTDGRCYVVGGDSMLYCLSSGSGGELWRYYAQASLPKGPTVAYGRVFLYVPGKGLVVLNAQSGVELDGFSYPQGRLYLGSVNNKLYIVTADRNIVRLDSSSGERLDQLGAKNFDFFVSNEKSGRIFIANRMGKIVCLQGFGDGQ